MTRSQRDAETPEAAVLVRRAQRGDRSAFDELVRRFQDMAVGYCAAVLGDFQLAEDAAQEAFLETYRILPAIRRPDAYSAYLRLTLRKHCDRMTRRKRVATVSLEAVHDVRGSESLSASAEARERASEIRVAVRSLPEAERTAVLLFYIGERSVKDVAAFLGVPISTVKNRLHTARRRLRERLLDSMETTMQEAVGAQRPSNDAKFRGQIISRLYETFREQFRSDAQTADRALLAQARDELRQAISEDALDTQTVRSGVRLLMWMDDFGAIDELLDHYLTQPLSLAEEFWARWTRIRGLAFRREAETVVDAQRQLMEFVRARLPGDPPVRLSAHEPFAPTEDLNEKALASDALAVFALGILEIGLCYHNAGIFDEWLTMVLVTIESVPKTSGNRLWRFFQLRHAIHLLSEYGRQEEAAALLDRMSALADEENDWQAPRWPIEALYMKMRLYGDAKDTRVRGEAGERAIRLLGAFQAASDSEPENTECVNVLRTLTNNVAAGLTAPGTYDIALTLWERLASKIPANDWSYLCFAQCVWATTKDRARTLELLRDAAACSFDGDLPKSFAERMPGFTDVRDDPEFLAALVPPAAHTTG